MSLWTKSLESVTFADLHDFCTAGHREGLQLDYKEDMPSDLAKTVAAFANTRGGLLVLGVHADKTTNCPVWPSDGMPIAEGLTEQVMQRCRDGIYPSLLPEIGLVIANPTKTDRVFLVVRVNESDVEPHSIANGTKVYVRTNDTNHPIELAHVDAISAMLSRRRGLEAARQILIDRHLARAQSMYPAESTFVWWSCTPEYPGEVVFSLNDCQMAVDGGGQMRVPDGYASFGTIAVDRNPKNPQDRVYTSAGVMGDIFYSRLYQTETSPFLPGVLIQGRTLGHLRHCATAYDRMAKRYPGILRYNIGVANAKGREMEVGRRSETGSKFIDSDFLAIKQIPFQSMADDRALQQIAFDLISAVFHGFDLGQPLPPSTWPITH